MLLPEMIRKLFEVFIISTISSVFGFIGINFSHNNMIISSIASGLGGVIGLLLFILKKSKNGEKDTEGKPVENTEEKPYGPWTQGILSQCFGHKKMAKIKSIKAFITILISSTILFFCLPPVISLLQGHSETGYFSIPFFVSIFLIWSTVSSKLPEIKNDIKEYKRYKRIFDNAQKRKNVLTPTFE